jgi:secreted PhoX family phosphatase
MGRFSRRTFLRQTAAASCAAFALQGLVNRAALFAARGASALGPSADVGYGPLFPTPSNNTGETLLAIPEGFQYNVIGKAGSIMSDGRPTPAAHDGMAAFDVGGLIHLVRNHENSGGGASSVAYGSLPYDAKATGGTTTLVVDPATRLLVQDFASLSGTVRNCAGGPTPWGSWLSNEETVVSEQTPGSFFTRTHGYIFEVPAAAPGETAPLPLKGMGRFSHEAAAVDPATSIVYETEDASPSGFYRYVPYEPGKLAGGGQLQMLAVAGRPQYDTRRGQQPGQQLPAIWVDLWDPDPILENGALPTVNQGIIQGGAIFARLEGCWYGDGSIFFVSTSGGNADQGQIWQYTPTGSTEGVLTLVFESPNAAVLNNPDNITVSPRGGLVLCEDGSGDEFLHGLTLQGQIFQFVKNIVPGNEGSEFAGATFSPDGQTLFFNLQGPGLTFALWPKPGYAWEDGAL